jgi:hypothetical protein
MGTGGSSFTGVAAALRRVVREEGEGGTVVVLLLLRVLGEGRVLLLRVVGEGRTVRAAAAAAAALVAVAAAAALGAAVSGGEGRVGVPDPPRALVRLAMVAGVSDAGASIGALTGVVARVAGAAPGCCFAGGAFFFGGILLGATTSG